MPRNQMTQDREAKFKAKDNMAVIRALRENHPILDMGAGFIPGVGLLQTADDVANPDVGLAGKAMAVAGMIPGGHLIKALRGRGKGVMSQMAPANKRVVDLEIELPENPAAMDRSAEMLGQIDRPVSLGSGEIPRKSDKMLDQILGVEVPGQPQPEPLIDRLRRRQSSFIEALKKP